MNLFFLQILFAQFLSINLKLPEEKKSVLLKEISKEQQYHFKYQEKIEYNPSKVKKLIDLYHFPEEYNFIEDTKAEIKYKNKGKCNCSWSISSTTALSYRFHKKGINIDLSPQYPLSCYIKNCSYENYLIDTQLNLV